MREYRARKKIYLQSISDYSSVVHHQEDEILQTDDNLNSSHECVGLPCQDLNATRRKTSAERMREYRRLRIHVVESELVQEPQHQVPYAEGSEDATLSNYSDFYRHRLAHEEFKIKFVENPFGCICSVCERLWIKDYLQSPFSEHEEILRVIVPHLHKDNIIICITCRPGVGIKSIAIDWWTAKTIWSDRLKISLQ
ncbi:uncharacterized protein TNCT_516581 [Trichonephila clavata]|uniref:Uncharacterized protein n=1 Tax=Trichonephila clavata TaxID=2740835 RepID=A0A8X6KEX0_TRICU|nr:uncharacterized protein TNCT_516581 [Trichonephila clavata]